VRRHWEYLARDADRAHEIYHDDAVLEFPQSGERFEGVANFREWRRQYPADLRFRIRRITAREDLVVVDCSVSYNGGPWQYGVQMLEFRDDKVARERIDVMEGWEAPEWRTPGARILLQTRRSEALMSLCPGSSRGAGRTYRQTRRACSNGRRSHR
jgi:ketosteroid isomerase-like protein